MIREFDAPWKEALDLFLEAFLRYCFPALHAQIDWRKPYRSLDAELQQIVREGELGETRADKLFQVSLLNGEEIWLLIHIEVQSQRDAQFPRAIALKLQGNQQFRKGIEFWEGSRLGLCEVVLGHRVFDTSRTHHAKEFPRWPSRIPWTDCSNALRRSPILVSRVSNGMSSRK